MKLSWLIFVLLMPVTAVFAAEQSGTADNLRIIQVDGHGIARSDPDQAFMSFAIETKGSTAKEAVEQNAAIASKVVAALKSKLAPGGKVETGGYSLMPLYGQTSAQSQSRIRDWISENDLAVDVDPTTAGSVLDAAQAAGSMGSSTINEQTGMARVDLRIEGARSHGG